MGAQNCGFGPAAELVAVSRLLSGHERIFVGDGVAAAFARRNADAFDGIREITGTAVMDGLLERSDVVVSVMDADLVVRSVVAGRPVVMVDSLLSFWQIRRPLARIRDLCASMPRSSFAAADRHLSTLSPHERLIAAHLLATHSVVQNFPGVTRRMAELVGLGVDPGGGSSPKMHVTGSVIDVEGLRNLPRDAEPQYDLLINVGGFKNFLLDFDANNDYIQLLRRWMVDLLRDWRRFARVLVCGGPFGAHRDQTVSVAGRQAECRFVRQRELLGHVASTPHYLLAPGLTALHESIALEQLPLAIHEQHYAHVFTVRQLGDTLFGRMAARFADVLPYHRVPEDDFAGTAELVRTAGRIREDDELYARFRQTVNERIEHYVSLTPAQRQQGVKELRDVLDGQPLSSVMAGIIPIPPAPAAGTRE